MNEDDEELARRQQALDERERELLGREEELARQARTQGTGQSSSAPRERLDRPPPVVAEGPRRSLAFLFVFLAALGLLGWIVLRPTQKSAKDAEAVPFESRRTTGLNLEVPGPPGPVPGAPVEPLPSPVRNEAADRLRQQEQELLLARQRAPILIAQGAGSGSRRPGSAGGIPASPVPPPPELPNLDRLLAVDSSRFDALGRAPSESIDPNTRFQRQLAKSSTPTSVASRTPDRNFLVLQGKFIDAVAETAINSDLPGQVRALVSYDVYAESGRRVMLPRGTRLIGEYNTAIAKGQERLFVVWTRAIRPDGIDIALLSGGSDPLGRAGLSGEVDTHFWTIFGASALLSIIGAGAATAGVNPGQDQFNSAAIYRAEIAESFNRSAGRVLDRYLDIKPTIKIANGETLKVFVARDLDFSTALAAVEPRDQVTVVR
jgi:type IV secretory pathway VirB10-like protein